MLLAAAMPALFRFVPNTHVRWRHALAGGLFVAIGFELAKRGLAWYLVQVPTYSLVYGAFATVPILLIWIYLGWVIVLLRRGDRRLCAEPADAHAAAARHARRALSPRAGSCCAN